MRLHLNLECIRGSILPFNYQSQLAAWVYHNLSRSDQELGSWLHDKGFNAGFRQYKLFSFGALEPKAYDSIRHEGLRLRSPELSWRLSFWLPEHLRHFIQGMFEQQEFELRISDYEPLIFRIAHVRIEDSLDFEQLSGSSTESFELSYQTLSPLNISVKQDSYEQASYLAPDEANYERHFLNGLRSKYEALQPILGLPELPNLEDLSFSPIGEPPKSKLITLKPNSERETRIRGYHFRFKLKAPALLHELGYYGGFGERCSMGFGMVRLVSAPSTSPEAAAPMRSRLLRPRKPRLNSED